MNRDEREAWFATLKPGDFVACRTIGGYSFGPWRRRVVARATGSTVWLAKVYSHQPDDKVTLKTRKLDVRPWTPGDQRALDDAEIDSQIRRWVGQHIGDGLDGKPIAPRVRAAMLRAIGDVADGFDPVDEEE